MGHVHDVCMSCAKQFFHTPQRIFATASGAQSVAVFGEGCSKMGSITLFTAACTTRSVTVGIPNGRFSALPGFSIHTRLTGLG